MKTVTLKKLSLLNFKGVRDLTFDFNGSVTNISGDNATGKTTIMDAFIWLLFGKDSTDRKDFEVKTLDDNNRPIPKIDHEVTAVLELDGQQVKLRRCYREKWQTRRGSSDTVMTGHETLFEIDDVPKQAGEYSSFINSIMDEELFKMLTSPQYFNSIKWQDRRMILTDVAGDIRDEDVAKERPVFQELLRTINGKSFDDIRKSIMARKRLLKEELEKIPARIDELTRTMPGEPDYEAVRSGIVLYEHNIKKIDEQIADVLKRSESEYEKQRERQMKIYELRAKQDKIIYDEGEKAGKENHSRLLEIQKLEDEISALETKSLQMKIDGNKNKIEYLTGQISHKRALWSEENSRTLQFDHKDFVCPACRRPFDDADIEAKKKELAENFNRSKVEKLTQISDEGRRLTQELKALNDESEKLASQIRDNVEKISILKGKLEKLQSFEIKHVNPENISQWRELDAEIQKLEEEPAGQIPGTSELEAARGELQTALDELKAKLAVREIIEKSKARVRELEKQSVEKAQQVADLEKQEYVMSQFEMTKNTLIEEKVNGMFTMVKFKMFETLINGAMEQTCQTLIGGVPWQDANNAGRINAGLDIINILGEKHGLKAPVFIDNAEAVNELIKVGSQLIRLVVTRDKELIVS